MSSKELPTDRLATTDEQGHRVFLYPVQKRGLWKIRREFLQAFLLVIFLALPWIQVHGHQWIWIDVAHRKFTIFGYLFWAHETPFIVFLLAMAGLTLALVTALWGRIWCGWACPQTVFIDFLFRRIETVIEGDGLQRKQLDQGPWTPDRFFKKFLKWSAFFLCSGVIAHSFLAYFVGAKPLLAMTLHSPEENWGSFLFVSFVTAVIAFDFGWFREQFCVIMCPYGRFQSLLMDPSSLVILYDQKRGEPRHSKELAPETPKGDCVNCYRCVTACPTGIDIRRGVQMECIACAACIDVCDDVMDRLHKPKGLIRYDARSPLPLKERYLRLRPLLYSFLLTIVIIGFAFGLSRRQSFEVLMVRAKTDPYIVSAENIVANRFVLDVFNLSQNPQTLEVSLVTDVTDGQPEQIGHLITPLFPATLQSGERLRAPVVLELPKSAFKMGKAKTKIRITNGSEVHIEEVSLVGPF